MAAILAAISLSSFAERAAAPSEAQDVEAVVEGNNAFALALYAQLRDCKEIKCINGASGKWCSSTRHGRHQV